jgi:hypothetical protein
MWTDLELGDELLPDICWGERGFFTIAIDGLRYVLGTLKVIVRYGHCELLYGHK